MKIGIWGYGFVGQGVHAILKANPIIYDVKKNYNTLEEIHQCDVIFICVPTPESSDGSQDTSIVTDILDTLYKNAFQGLVILKSTVLYERIKKYEQLLNFCFNPEFLNQNTFILDSILQSTIILGGEVKATKEAYNVYIAYTDLDDANFELCTLKEACDFKMIRNVYGAYKVLFWEFVQDTTGNARKMHDLLDSFPQGDMAQVGMDGFRGFGGACFPKDISAWNKEHNHILTQTMLEYNKRLAKI